MPWSSAQAAPVEQLCEGAVAVVATLQVMETSLNAGVDAFEERARDGDQLRGAPPRDLRRHLRSRLRALQQPRHGLQCEYRTFNHPSIKVNDLTGAGKSYCSLSDILDMDIQN
ncbi:hypothetical protein BAE44_0024621 [Dichanthelium oligosanthes]|uniref:Uncharacterized protein n=1 Tax=Dichanthelium oligosanthes TaxID=888268 RepID=A0A1E5UNC2_9POAL|nr:hypothetical protein BAE44_0024621 [Dichanthelium oligosanthes]